MYLRALVSRFALLLLVTAASGADLASPSKIPAGLSGGDWSGIRSAYENSRHAIEAQPTGGHLARNPGQQWHTEFDGRGFTVKPEDGAWSWGLELTGVGKGSSDGGLDRTAPEVRVEKEKLRYVWSGSLTEWFINDERGLEQGWTFSQAPAGITDGRIDLELKVRGSLSPEVSSDGSSVAFQDGSGLRCLSYGGLKVWDADGKILAARFRPAAARGDAIRLEVDAASARYPITIDPIAQQVRLKASNANNDDTFGVSVAASGDTVVVGAQDERSASRVINGDQSDNSAVAAGAAYVFVRGPGGTWTQQAYLKSSNLDAYDQFGRCVAISGDTIAVSANRESSAATGVNGDQSDNSAPSAGAVYIFVRSGTTWTQQAYLKASNTGSDDYFGSSLALVGDALVVGAPYEDADTMYGGNQADNGAADSGAAYLFRRSGTVWSQEFYLKAWNVNAGDNFGWTVGISGDSIVVGAPQEDSAATGVNGNIANNAAPDTGAAYVFVKNAGIWADQAYLKASNAQGGDNFGMSLAMSGNTVIVGAPGESSAVTGINGNQANNLASRAGAAYIFQRSGNVWTQTTYLKASNTDAADEFGSSVALDGDFALVAGPNEDSNASGVNGGQTNNSFERAGAAYLFRRVGGVWGQTAYLKSSQPTAYTYFGASIGLSYNLAIVGSVYADSSQGDVSVFNTMESYLVSASGAHGTVSGGGNHVEGSTATLTPIPDPGYVFGGWSGDASGSANPLAVVVNGPKTIVASFISNTADSDGDGLNDYLELVVYGTNVGQADSDSDGLSDAWEVGIGRYSVVAGSFTWAQARADAKSRGGDLASFPTEDRWNRAMDTLGPDAFDTYTGLWIGASDAVSEGVWTWVDGEVFSYSRWGTGRPSGTPGNTLDFVEVSGGDGAEIGKWYDRSSATSRDGYVLETGYATNPTVADADGDGLNDGAEQAAGSSPFVADTDGDGLTDPQEVNLTHTSPKLADSDNDGTSDAAEDLDGDGLGNLVEIYQHGTDPLLADTDGDHLSDGLETSYPGSYYQTIAGSFSYAAAAADAAAKRGRVAAFPDTVEYARVAAEARRVSTAHLWIGLSDAAVEGIWKWTDASTASYTRWLSGQPDGGITENQVVILPGGVQWADAAAAYLAGGYIFERPGLNPLAKDTDADGLDDDLEVNSIHSYPQRADSDDDGLEDGVEVNNHQTSPMNADTDEDGLPDKVEIEVHHSNPKLKDSDGDGFDDLFEVNTGFDPTLAGSSPDSQSTLLTAVEFRFNAANGASYRVEASTNLVDWTVIENGIAGQGAVVTRFYSIENQPHRYFRSRRN